jgi:hypothetical protein
MHGAAIDDPRAVRNHVPVQEEGVSRSACTSRRAVHLARRGI